jgi:catechol 2,3-dioxygenase-like lactoylglutathione lyase family enzyme
MASGPRWPRDARGMEQRLSLITLGVADTRRARAFYEALGWSGESPDGDVVFFQAAGLIFAVWGREKLAEDSTVHDSGGWGGVTLAHNVSSPAEVDHVLAQAEAAGATIGRPGAPTVWGGYSGIFIDPDGHPWEVAHNPGFTLGADGSTRLHP